MDKLPYQKFMADAARRRARIVKLRDAGKTFDEIGAALEITRQRASQIYIKEKRKAKA